MSGSIVPPGVGQIIAQLQNLVQATWSMSENLSSLAATASSTAPATHGFAITPSDTRVFAPPTRMIWVGGIGNLVVLLQGDTAPVTLTAVPADTMLSLAATKVMAATTATSIVGLY